MGISQSQPLFSYADGKILLSDEITLSPYDLGFLRGYVVFDVMTTENGKPFLWERHFERLMRSAAALHLAVPVSKEEYEEILDALIGKNGSIGKISFRTVLSGGQSRNGFAPEEGKETFIILAEAAHACPIDIYEKGVKTITLEYERPIPQVKLANHVLAIRDLPRRREAGAFEAIYVNGGNVSEASQSNLFIVKDGRLVTTWDNVLWGITQGLVLELAETLDIPAEKKPIILEDLLAVDEVFITGSSKRIVPVVQIDETKIGSGMPGPMTRQLMSAFDDFVKRY